MKTSFKARVLRMGLGSFVDINILVMKYLFLHILHFFRISQIKIYKNFKKIKTRGAKRSQSFTNYIAKLLWSPPSLFLFGE